MATATSQPSNINKSTVAPISTPLTPASLRAMLCSPDVVDKPLDEEIYLIHSASMSQNHAHGLEMVRMLVEEFHDDANRRSSRNKSTPLMGACSKTGNLALVKYLVEEARVNADDAAIDGTTALNLAASYGHSKIVNYLMSGRCSAAGVAACGLSLVGTAISSGSLETTSE